MKLLVEDLSTVTEELPLFPKTLFSITLFQALQPAVKAGIFILEQGTKPILLEIFLMVPCRLNLFNKPLYHNIQAIMLLLELLFILAQSETLNFIWKIHNLKTLKPLENQPFMPMESMFQLPGKTLPLIIAIHFPDQVNSIKNIIKIKYIIKNNNF
jgi:hypothetical protein